MKTSLRLPLDITIHPGLRDHRIESRAVLPAVEALRLMAASVQAQWPDRDLRVMTDVSFPRFLFLEDDADRIAGINEVRIDDQDDMTAGLLTLTHSASGNITRAREHVCINIPNKIEEVEIMHFLQACRLTGDCIEITPVQLYEELVPFGPAFRNVAGLLNLTEEGAMALVQAADDGQPVGPLGSPYPLDAAFHCVCAWGQRFAGIVAFPVGFEKRYVIEPTVAGAVYFARIVPIRTDSEPLVFDLWIYSLDGLLHEATLGVAMRDVSNGRLRPPAWIRA